MFFSAELLSKRDSGFGLLWLAATLGSKSSFKKLPRRSIQTADIPELCSLISHPQEPLALRLSSNLMVGVARVYKIKHEIFIADVNNCFATLKKAVQDLHALGALSEEQLQMGQPTVRSDVLNLRADPTTAVALEFNAFDASWDDISGFASQCRRETVDDDEFTLSNKFRSKSKSKPSITLLETGRAGLFTLDEHNEHLLSTSFEGNASFAGIDPSSSQMDPDMRFGSYALDENIFGAGDQLEFGVDFGVEIGDDLARELGEGWGVEIQNLPTGDPIGIDLQTDFQPGDDAFQFDENPGICEEGGLLSTNEDEKTKKFRGKKRPFTDSDKENRPPASLQGSLMSPHPSARSRSRTPSHVPLADVVPPNGARVNLPGIDGRDGGKPACKPKRVRLLLDTRTELTDEELKAAREKYVEGQRTIRLDMERRRLEKGGGKILEDLIWAVPEGFTAPALASFWTEIYKVQVESRSGAIHLDERLESPRKRRKFGDSPLPLDDNHHPTVDPGGAFGPENDDYALMGGNLEANFGFDAMEGGFQAPADFGNDPSRIHSSEEPERGRNIGSHPPSNFGPDAELMNPSSGTQCSAFFPWDNAAGTSSSAGADFAPPGIGSDRLSLDNADVRIKAPNSSHSGSRRESSLVPSQTGSMIGLKMGISPDRHGHSNSVLVGEDFQFDVTDDAVPGQDTQGNENNTVALERTSYNFLGYCKMQIQGLPGDQNTLDFDDIVPRATSTRRVAAAAFHHCLVLATKDLITVRQQVSFGRVIVKIN